MPAPRNAEQEGYGVGGPSSQSDICAVEAHPSLTWHGTQVDNEQVSPKDRVPLDTVDPNKKFGVLRSWATGPYVVGGGTSMMGDSIEHVLSYWVLWETFHSPALVGFQLLSHWAPFLLLSTWAGA